MATNYLPDTNILIAALRGRTTVLNRLAGLATPRFFLSAIVLSELTAGAEKSQRPARALAAVAELTREFQTLPYDAGTARSYARIRTALERKGIPIGPMDLLIAAQAMSRDLVLVTDNERELKRVPGLRIENWMR